MYPILDRYGPFLLYSYSVVLGLGLLAGIGLTVWLSQRPLTKMPPASDWFDAVLICLSAGLVGGRIGFVFINWHYFQQRPMEMWQIWQGGLSYQGALLCGLLALWGWTWWHQLSFSNHAGFLAPAFALASTFGWLACLLAGCVYGAEVTGNAWQRLLSADLPDTFGVYSLRYQTQLLGMSASFLIFLLLLRLRRRWQTGLLFWLALLLLSIVRLLVSFLRGDTVPVLGGLRIDTLFEALVVIISLILLQYQRSTQVD